MIPASGLLEGKTAAERLVVLARRLEIGALDSLCETGVNRKAVYLHYPFWVRLDPAAIGLTEDARSKLLDSLRKRWADAGLPFPSPG